ncbi:MAG: hypothetical protein ACRYGK_12895 [Janthinobacterium lividum]
MAKSFWSGSLKLYYSNFSTFLYTSQGNVLLLTAAPFSLAISR